MLYYTISYLVVSYQIRSDPPRGAVCSTAEPEATAPGPGSCCTAKSRCHGAALASASASRSRARAAISPALDGGFPGTFIALRNTYKSCFAKAAPNVSKMNNNYTATTQNEGNLHKHYTRGSFCVIFVHVGYFFCAILAKPNFVCFAQSLRN